MLVGEDHAALPAAIQNRRGSASTDETHGMRHAQGLMVDCRSDHDGIALGAEQERTSDGLARDLR